MAEKDRVGAERVRNRVKRMRHDHILNNGFLNGLLVLHGLQ
jgi:hypothetical protein